MKPHKVGVVVPARNALRTIELLLDTVSAQTYPCGAYIADDASDDGMTEFLRDRPDWYAGYRLLDDRAGWPGATNAAASLAIADGCTLLQIAAADDFLRLDAIERLVGALGARNDFVVPVSQQIGEQGVKQVSEAGLELDDFARYHSEHGKSWCKLIDKALIRSSVWSTVGGYSTDITIPDRPWGCAEDWDFWIKVFRAGFTSYTVLSDPVYYYVMHPGQLGRGREQVHELTVKALSDKYPDLPWGQK